MFKATAHIRARCSACLDCGGGHFKHFKHLLKSKKKNYREEWNKWLRPVCSHYLCCCYVENYEISLLNKPVPRDKTNRTHGSFNTLEDMSLCPMCVGSHPLSGAVQCSMHWCDVSLSWPFVLLFNPQSRLVLPRCIPTLPLQISDATATPCDVLMASRASRNIVNCTMKSGSPNKSSWRTFECWFCLWIQISECQVESSGHHNIKYC